MSHLSLRLRIFLFFGLIGLGSIAVVLAALLLGYRQLGSPDALSSFVTVGIVAAFGILALATFVWRLFDENVSKPIESLAAQLRVRAESGVETEFDEKAARYLGDLAPAACATSNKLRKAAQATAETVALKTERLERQRAQLLRILSDIPVAVIVATQDDQIVLYDGQAADLMENEAPARLNGSVCDYLDKGTLHATLVRMKDQDHRRGPITIKGKSGAIYSGHIRIFDDDNGYMVMLEPLDPDAARPLVYDFDLFNQTPRADIREAALRDLTFVVFDSETTGLDPQSDAVVQLGAVRIVNRRIITAETFDVLVNPGRPIPAQSTRVHGIDDTMVAHASDFAAVRKSFQTYVGDAVLIAHNAPFDMAFLNRDGAAFHNPVMDTVHLSAIVFGGSAVHTLDALCERLDVDIPDHMRHTALGDAMATAKVFVAMLPILEARGLLTFRQLQAEATKHSRILKVET
ncbi:3'-5' exonuclease [Yoonia sediminilitoris]|uniref:DNA-directed DNA polymerase n=1 Tax=Yoonia sediminilitoris TaxID=1286148 RepID=A0A2T6KLD6_9RHOB|nr:3'-5' exonuclease [Yoonia sediminilitoris]PUB17016.1 DNA polymerase-3 subunit epsilon [Yoonia sediminilitoris]RCW97311.1 DNA polymerase-3 subunit epsilon [Yoonia sediminilitoris]